MEKRTVVIIDDHLLIAKAISSLIGQLPKYKVLYEAASGVDFIEWLKNQKRPPDIVLLDISMPQMNGYETARWIKDHHPAVHIIALTMINDEPSIINMIRAGAGGYLLKDVHPSELEKALDCVMHKGYYYPEWVANTLVRSITDEFYPAKTMVKLTEKEIYFLNMVCTEMTYKEIAAKMKLSTRTVEGYRDQLFDKLNVKSRVGLVLYAIRNQVVQV
jgi:DNA-binding NarL/FixJ family response regulator